MPKWGLTSGQLTSQPWGLDADLLRSAKVITNSVEGDVYLNKLEQLVVDSPPLQRLRRVRQLGTSHLVYPDGSHHRFGHVLGALRVAQDLVDSVFDHRYRPKAQPDLFSEWESVLDEETFARQQAEVTVLARLGALLHDLCHVPFGHTVEDDLGLLDRHDANGPRFDYFWDQLAPRFRLAICPDLKAELRRLILSKEEVDGERPDSRYPFVEDIVGNTICADLLDYLPRDHHFLGLPIALGHRFMEFMYVTPANHPDMDHRERLVIQLVRDDHERPDIESEILKFLRYRYEESERVLTHHAKLAADAMIGKLLAMWRDAMWIEEVHARFGELSPASRRDVDEARRWIEQQATEAQLRSAAGGDGDATASAIVGRIDDVTQGRLEQALRVRGDDGLIEHIWAESDELSKRQKDSRREAISVLSRSVLDRQLYKVLGISAHDDSKRRRDAARIFDRWGRKDERRRLELRAANYIGLDEKWHLVMWIPHPDMKLKVADVLIGLQDDEISRLHDYSRGCQDIYDSHERLWAVSVFGHPSLRDDCLRSQVLLAWLKEQLRIPGWERGPTLTKEALVVEHFAKEHDVTASTKERLLSEISGKGGGFDTLQALQHRLQLVYENLS